MPFFMKRRQNNCWQCKIPTVTFQYWLNLLCLTGQEDYDRLRPLSYPQTVSVSIEKNGSIITVPPNSRPLSFLAMFWYNSLTICSHKLVYAHLSLRKQPTFDHATIGFPAKWHLRNECRNSILMTCYHSDLGSAPDWSWHVGNSQIWVVTHHQYRISALVLRRHWQENQ